MSAKLIRDSDGKEWPVIESCILGRSSSADIAVDDADISRHHAMIRSVSGRWMYFDLDSTNGSRINGRPVSKPIELVDGDAIAIGDSLFLFEMAPRVDDSGEPALSKGMTMMEKVRRAPMTLLAADIMGYATIAEKIAEKDLADLLRTWSHACTKILEERGAIIGNIVGDAVFAYWEDASPGTRESAIAAASRLVNISDSFSDEQRALLRARDLTWKCGVGMHIGKATVGALSRGSLSPFGTQVNLAFRVESLTRRIGKDILGSEEFLAGWSPKDSEIKSEGEYSLKGFSKPLQVYSIAIGSDGGEQGPEGQNS